MPKPLTVATLLTTIKTASATSAHGNMTAADRWAYQHQANRSTQEDGRLRSSYDHGVQFYRALLREHLPTDSRELILDLPCGEGQMLYTLRKLGYHHTEGFDIDANRVAVGKRLGLPVAVGDVFE